MNAALLVAILLGAMLTALGLGVLALLGLQRLIERAAERLHFYD